jgi:predicted ABC-type ATPase
MEKTYGGKDDWYIYDNSGSSYKLVAKNVEKNIEIVNFDLYKKITGSGK